MTLEIAPEGERSLARYRLFDEPDWRCNEKDVTLPSRPAAVAIESTAMGSERERQLRYWTGFLP